MKTALPRKGPRSQPMPPEAVVEMPRTMKGSRPKRERDSGGKVERAETPREVVSREAPREEIRL